MFVHQCAEYQNRRGEEKKTESTRRTTNLSQAPVDITPVNKAQHVWTESKDNLDKFESEWSMKPVAIRGIFDHEREVQVAKQRNGEKGVDIVTPFYTHLDAEGKEQAILVNRGWVPQDLKDQRMHLNQTSAIGTIKGVLYRGDNATKYSKLNNPTLENYSRVVPYDLSLITQSPN